MAADRGHLRAARAGGLADPPVHPAGVPAGLGAAHPRDRPSPVATLTAQLPEQVAIVYAPLDVFSLITSPSLVIEHVMSPLELWL